MTAHRDGGYRRLLGAAWLTVALIWGSPGLGAGTDKVPSPPLLWQSASNRVDARITGWPLTRVLGRIAAATGWEVFVEPGQDRPINATFTDLPPREALTRLLGGLNFSLQPQPGAAAKLLIYQSDRDQATRRIAPPPRSGRIPNELVVRLKAGSGVSVDDLAKLLGGEVVGRVESLNAYRLRFESAEAADAARRKLESVREREGLAGIEDNYQWDPPADLETSGTGQAAALPLKPRLSPDGKHLVVGIIDTAAQTLSPDREAFILSRTDIVQGQPADDGLWHGTAMADAFLQGVNRTDNSESGSTVRLRLYNAYGANEGATSFDVTRAVFQAAQDGVSMLSLSLGGPQGSPMLSEALASFAEQGGLVFVAAGNQGTDAPFFPAADPSVIAVSAVNAQGLRMPWANYGTYVDVGAPGVVVVPFGGQRWLVSGTSPATAMTAGMGAGYAARTGSPLSKARTVMLQQMPFQP